MPNGDEYTYNARPDEGFFQGLLGGLTGQIQKRRDTEEAEIRDTRATALKWLQSLPMTEHNAPIITNLAVDLLQAKPGKKHWSDAIFATGSAKNQFLTDLYGKLRSVLPQPQGGEPAPTDISDLIPQQSTRPRTVAGASALPPAPRTEIPWEQPGSTGAVRPRRPQPGVLEFPEPGKYKTLPETYEDATGQSFIMQYDERTGTSRRIPLGDVTTGRERVASINATAKANAAKEAVGRGVMKDVLMAASADGLSPEAFHALPYEAQQKYYSAAGIAARTMNEAKLAKTEQATKTDVAREAMFGRMPSANANLNESGLTPNQALTDWRQRMARAQEYFEKFTPLRARAEAALRAYQDLVYNRLKTQYFGVEINPEYQNEKAKLSREYQQALAEAQAYAEQANAQFPEFIEGGLGTAGKPGDTPFPYMKMKPATAPGGTSGGGVQPAITAPGAPISRGTGTTGARRPTAPTQFDQIVGAGQRQFGNGQPGQGYDVDGGSANVPAAPGTRPTALPASAFGVPWEQLQASVGKYFVLPDPATGTKRKGRVKGVNQTTGMVQIEWMP